MARAVDALESAGNPIPPTEMEALQALLRAGTSEVQRAMEIMHRHSLLNVEIDQHGFGTPTQAGERPVLDERGWRTYVIRIDNPHGHVLPIHLLVNATPAFSTAPAPGNFSPAMSLSQMPHSGDRLDKTGLVADSWLKVELADDAPLTGFPIEYRLVNLYSSAGANREGRMGLTLVDDSPVGAHSGNQTVAIPFEVRRSFDVKFEILDENDETCVAAVVITDADGRVFPPQAMRVAPDMRFQPQIYRGSGETLRLPAGRYSLSARRGPEYLPTHTSFEVVGHGTVVAVRLRRWFDAPAHGWYPGDPHLHAAGCSHYESPTEGVRPETMIRQVRGEALAIGGVLTWGPGYYHQKQFFTGTAISPAATLEHPDLQRANNQAFVTAETKQDLHATLRYDLEVSGFPSSHLGHIMLLNLSEQNYPNTTFVNDWPSWTLPILRWAKSQGATVGYAHCGFGMNTSTDVLPNYEMPLFNSIGTNEALIDVVHGAVDFLAGAEAQPTMELNGWYHLLNCGFRLAMVGETDYPCIFDERPGIGRTYVQLDVAPVGDTGWKQWISGLESGRLYFGDGRSHFPIFTVNGAPSGSTVSIPAGKSVTIDVTVAAYLEPQVTTATERIRTLPSYAKPSWHLERARINNSRLVPVEIVVNGQPVITHELIADGTAQELSFDLELTDSAWIAVRVLPSGHTQPVFVEVDKRPVRASRRSAEWCRSAVDVLWEEKVRFIREAERSEASQAFDFARTTYDRVLSECAEGS